MRSVVRWTLDLGHPVAGPRRRTAMHRAKRASDVVERALRSVQPDAADHDALLVALSGCAELIPGAKRDAWVDRVLDVRVAAGSRRRAVLELLANLDAFEHESRSRVVHFALGQPMDDGAMLGALLACGTLQPFEQDALLGHLEKPPVDGALVSELLRSAAPRIDRLAPGRQDRLVAMAAHIPDLDLRVGVLQDLSRQLARLAPAARETLCGQAMALTDPTARAEVLPGLLQRSGELLPTTARALVVDVLDHVDDPAAFAPTCALACAAAHLTAEELESLRERAARGPLRSPEGRLDRVAAACAVALAGQPTIVVRPGPVHALRQIQSCARPAVQTGSDAHALLSAALVGLAAACPVLPGDGCATVIERTLDHAVLPGTRAAHLALLASAARGMSESDQSLLLSAALTTKEPGFRMQVLAAIAPHVGYFSHADGQRFMQAVARLPPPLAVNVVARMSAQLHEGLSATPRKLRRTGGSDRFMPAPVCPTSNEAATPERTSRSSSLAQDQIQRLVDRLTTPDPAPANLDLRPAFARSRRLLQAVDDATRRALVGSIVHAPDPNHRGMLAGLAAHLDLFEADLRVVILREASRRMAHCHELLGALISSPCLDWSCSPFPDEPGTRRVATASAAKVHLHRMDAPAQIRLIAWSVAPDIESHAAAQALAEVARHAHDLTPQAAEALFDAAFSSRFAATTAPEDDPGALVAWCDQQEMQEEVLLGLLGRCAELPDRCRNQVLARALSTAHLDDAFRVTMALSGAVRMLSVAQRARLVAVAQGGGHNLTARQAARTALAGLEPHRVLAPLVAGWVSGEAELDIPEEAVISCASRHLGEFAPDLQCRLVEWSFDAEEPGGWQGNLLELARVADAMHDSARSLLMDAVITAPGNRERCKAMQVLAPRLSHFSESDQCRFLASVGRFPSIRRRAAILGAQLPTGDATGT